MFYSEEVREAIVETHLNPYEGLKPQNPNAVGH